MGRICIFSWEVWLINDANADYLQVESERNQTNGAPLNNFTRFKEKFCFYGMTIFVCNQIDRLGSAYFLQSPTFEWQTL